MAPGLTTLLMVWGMTLVTADMYIGIIGIFHKRIGWGSFAWEIFLGYLGNFLGSMFFMWLFCKCGAYAAWPWMAKSHAIGTARWATRPHRIVCTWMLQTAAILFVKAEGDIAKIAMAAYGPLAVHPYMAPPRSQEKNSETM